ncbi:transcriptional regulator family: Centromere protein B, DNA-binding region [Penicillium roqueforti]|uniref:HTH CENPB-type domain-containing protein n=2 Tax=Penicillium TaxID=5073 RepID=A0A1V6X2D7_PENNA|nr:transcriptional regulator family: Centromere protein B, DNA-binding region [Penicillium roqueforti]OQE69310.1 hypothetical protein PENNAL_c0139G08359 [Penicillium nalgiovense]CRL31135.1 DDE superfamily endonuclease, CENP-B-like [Penicillium camemberti]KAI2741916.1 transcriptional regulator family: Centromere protein B, DNA-binding region [Penicillium roqueforti]KAI2767699.1 transcriptional regulator family: Centromere protein B, DNA-binding region [Penicillium roqueforti]
MPNTPLETEIRISSALEAFSTRDRPIIKQLALEFNVSYDTLRRRVRGAGPRTARIPTNRALNAEQEKALHTWIVTLDNAYSPPTAAMVEQCANAILQRSDPTRSPLSKNWVYNFLNRIPKRLDLKFVTQKPKERSRMQAEDISCILIWYERFQNYVQSNDLRPKDIYNFDESGFQIGQGKPQKVVSKSPTAYTPNGGIAEGITTIECVAADGWKMPPWFLVKGQYHMENWYRTTNLPPDWTIAPTPNGYTTDEIAMQWLIAFHKATKPRVSTGGFRLVLMDNHGSHRTKEFIEFANENRIILYCFMPHTTHLSQPLDSAPFQTYKHFFKTNNNSVVQWGGVVDRKCDFFREIINVRAKGLTPRIIRAGFEKTGIYPFNVDLIVDPLLKKVEYGPDLLVFGGGALGSDSEGGTDFPSSITNSPPQGVHRTNQSTKKLEDDIQELEKLAMQQSDLSSRILHRTKLLCQSARISANLAAQYSADNTRILKHKVHRDTRQTKRQIDEGGPLSVKDANRSIKAREDRETAKEERRINRALKKAAASNVAPTPASQILRELRQAIASLEP